MATLIDNQFTHLPATAGSVTRKGGNGVLLRLIHTEPRKGLGVSKPTHWSCKPFNGAKVGKL